MSQTKILSHEQLISRKIIFFINITLLRLLYFFWDEEFLNEKFCSLKSQLKHLAKNGEDKKIVGGMNMNTY